jgi:hypothetical protein
MLKKDYYLLLSMAETIEKVLRYTDGYHSAEELYQNDRDFDLVPPECLFAFACPFFP